MTKEEEVAIVQKAAEQLGEQFDTVHIFVTRHEPGELNGTVNFCRSVGNWFARYGQIRHWVELENERARIDVRKTSDEKE